MFRRLSKFFQRKISPEQAYIALAEAIREDPSYAHSWHCNIAMSVYDTIPAVVMSHPDAHKIGNDAATRFMKMAFDVETSRDYPR